jgi:hypothetical protein
MRPATLLGPAVLLLAPVAALLGPSSASSCIPWSIGSIPLVAEIPIHRPSGYPIASGTLPAKRVSEALGLVDASLVKGVRDGEKRGNSVFYRLPKPNVSKRDVKRERESEGDRSNSDRGVGLELRLLFHVVGVAVEVPGVVDGIVSSVRSRMRQTGASRRAEMGSKARNPT